MRIRFGLKSKVLDHVAALEHVCSSCNHESHIAVGQVYYLHLFGIPAKILRKKIHLQCGNCKKNTIFHKLKRSERPDKPKVFMFSNIWMFNFLFLGFFFLAFLGFLQEVFTTVF